MTLGGSLIAAQILVESDFCNNWPCCRNNKVVANSLVVI